MRKLDIDELNRISADDFKVTPKIPLVVVLDNVRSLNNVGSVFRTSDAYLVEKIWLCGITATPPNKEIHKTALGAEDTVEWAYEADTCNVVKSLLADGYSVYAVEQTEGSLHPDEVMAEPGTKTAVIFGNEVKGVLQEAIDLCTGTIELPQFGTKHSLNVSVTAGIIIWEFSKKLR